MNFPEAYARGGRLRAVRALPQMRIILHLTRVKTPRSFLSTMANHKIDRLTACSVSWSVHRPAVVIVATCDHFTPRRVHNWSQVQLVQVSLPSKRASKLFCKCLDLSATDCVGLSLIFVVAFFQNVSTFVN